MRRTVGLLLLGTAGLLWISNRRLRIAAVCTGALLTTIQQVHADELTAADFSFAHSNIAMTPDEGLTAADFSFANIGDQAGKIGDSALNITKQGENITNLTAADFSFVCTETLCYRAPGKPDCDCAVTNVCTCGGKCDCCRGDTRPVVRVYGSEHCPPCERLKKEAHQVKAVRFVEHEAPDWVEAYPTMHFQSPDGWRQLKGWQGAEWFEREYRRAMEPRQVIGSQPIGPLGWAWPALGACYSMAG